MSQKLETKMEYKLREFNINFLLLTENYIWIMGRYGLGSNFIKDFKELQRHHTTVYKYKFVNIPGRGKQEWNIKFIF